MNDFLETHCEKIMDYTFTAKTEEALDKIAHKKMTQEAMLSEFYEKFEPQVAKASEKEKKAVTERMLGKDPKTGKAVIARLSRRHGALVQIGEMGDEEKPRFASLNEEQLLSTLTLEEALKLFDLPREVGHYEEEVITAHVGRYGPYIKHKGAFYSLNKTLNPRTISEEEAITLMQERSKIQQVPIKTFSEDAEVTIRAGRYGPYIKTAKRNIKIPAEINPSSLTWQEVQDLIEKTPPSKRKRKKK